jgi:hypothetical protein
MRTADRYVLRVLTDRWVATSDATILQRTATGAGATEADSEE